VSILIVAGAGVGRCLGWHPRSKVSMMIMRPPQRGHGCSGVVGSSGLVAVALMASIGSSGTASIWRARAMLSARTAASEQAVVADAVEAAGQDVHQEAADELVGRQADFARSIQRVTRVPTSSQNAAFWQHLPANQQEFAPKRSTDYAELVESLALKG
jgi:hypothetical protein